tara:strand:+ start:250 stop:1146 length:897 start_codon:yes stop_codon:yes gene_type:complete
MNMAMGTVFHHGLGEPEGPVLLADGRWGVVEMSTETGHVSIISPDGLSKKVIVKTGRPNGMVQDGRGRLWVAESMNPPSLLRVGLDGECDVKITSGDGMEFLFPNDLAFGPDKALYMTDSGVNRLEFLRARERGCTDYPINGRIFRVDLLSMTATLVDDGLPFANGLAFGLGDALYVSATVSGLLYRYEWHKDGTLKAREEFANVLDDSKLIKGFTGGDGLAVAQNGDIYCAVVGQGDVTVVDTLGDVVYRIDVGGDNPTNVAFGPQGAGDIYITVKDTGTLERHHVGIDGLPLNLLA